MIRIFRRLVFVNYETLGVEENGKERGQINLKLGHLKLKNGVGGQIKMMEYFGCVLKML